jgi:integrase/recombinase XerD
MPRDTFAVSLLEACLPKMQIPLGHSSIRVVERHYAPWVRSRQERVEETLKRTWHRPNADEALG